MEAAALMNQDKIYDHYNYYNNMKLTLEQTWNPGLKSFIESAQHSDFPIQHLPLGVFKPISDGNYRIGTRIGDMVLDLALLDDYGFFDDYSWSRKKLFNRLKLNRFMALGNQANEELRCRLAYLLSVESDELRNHHDIPDIAFHHYSQVVMSIPVEIRDYTDFYSSKEHATNLGIMFRGKENALNENWLHIPIGYHGRASSVVVSETEIKRPKGQMKPHVDQPPIFGETKALDIELEMGFFIGKPNNLGEPILMQNADEHIWGLVLVNDWSARDIQRWEYVPLGPFLGKNFATSISPWVVTRFALEPFKVKAPQQNPEPLDYLKRVHDDTYDIQLKVELKSEVMENWQVLSESNFKYVYWTQEQQLVHHTANGCNLSTGDLLASGTISGSNKNEFGSLIELTWKGENPIRLNDGTQRTYLQNGDSVKISGCCQNEHYRIGFGEVTGTIV